MDTSQGSDEGLAPLEYALRVGLKFNNVGLLTRALTHRSYLNEHKGVLEDNERLEFLGDAVLDFLVGAWLYNRFPEVAEGQLTRYRAALVGNHQLAEFARKIKLGTAVRLGKGEDESGGRKRTTLLGAVFEAVVGAYYLDQGIKAVNEFIEPFLDEAVQKILVTRSDQDPKSELQEWSQAQGYGTPSYRTVSSIGPDHEKVFEVEVSLNGEVFGKGKGSSKNTAEKISAQMALETLEIKKGRDQVRVSPQKKSTQMALETLEIEKGRDQVRIPPKKYLPRWLWNIFNRNRYAD